MTLSSQQESSRKKNPVLNMDQGFAYLKGQATQIHGGAEVFITD